jgi:hypothetical protein
VIVVASLLGSGRSNRVRATLTRVLFLMIHCHWDIQINDFSGGY